MQFTKITAATFIALAQLVSADSESFGLISTHSASPVHLLSVLDRDGLYITSGSDSFSAVVTDAGKLKFSNDKYAVFDKDGKWTFGSESDAATGFGVSNGSVTYEGGRSFYAVPTSDAGKYEVSEKNADGAIGISFAAFTPTGSRAADFTPSEGDADADADSKTSAAPATAATTTTAATAPATTQVTKSTVAAISQITDGQIQNNAKTVEVQSENGVAKLAMNGAGAIAAAVALLM